MDEQSDRERLKKAFRILRSRGYTARMNFMCCGSCGWYALGGSSLSGHRDATKQQPGKVVFYHQQAEDRAFKKLDFYQGRPREIKTETLQSNLYLQWAGSGQEIVEILEGQGLTVQWNGTPEGAIGVMA